MKNSTKVSKENKAKELIIKELTKTKPKAKAKPTAKAKEKIKAVKKAVVSRYGKQVPLKPSIEVKTLLKVLIPLEGKETTYKAILNLYINEFKRNDKTTNGKNFLTRFERSLTSGIKDGITRDSVQGIKFNLLATYNNINVVPSKKFTTNDYNRRGSLNKEPLRNNSYTFKIVKGKKITIKNEVVINKTLEKEIQGFKESIK